jgi:hypothetical protein
MQNMNELSARSIVSSLNHEDDIYSDRCFKWLIPSHFIKSAAVV